MSKHLVPIARVRMYFTNPLPGAQYCLLKENMSEWVCEALTSAQIRNLYIKDTILLKNYLDTLFTY
jgi:hypothetical protein